MVAVGIVVMVLLLVVVVAVVVIFRVDIIIARLVLAVVTLLVLTRRVRGRNSGRAISGGGSIVDRKRSGLRSVGVVRVLLWVGGGGAVLGRVGQVGDGCCCSGHGSKVAR